MTTDQCLAERGCFCTHSRASSQALTTARRSVAELGGRLCRFCALDIPKVYMKYLSLQACLGTLDAQCWSLCRGEFGMGVVGSPGCHLVRPPLAGSSEPTHPTSRATTVGATEAGEAATVVERIGCWHIMGSGWKCVRRRGFLAAVCASSHCLVRLKSIYRRPLLS